MKPSAVSDYDLGPYYKAPEVSFKSFPLYDSLMRGSHGAAAALAVEQRTAKTGERAITMLESKGIKVTLDTLMKEFIKEDNGNSFIRGIAVRCKSWMCQDCRRRKGFEVMFRKYEALPLKYIDCFVHNHCVYYGMAKLFQILKIFNIFLHYTLCYSKKEV